MTKPRKQGQNIDSIDFETDAKDEILHISSGKYVINYEITSNSLKYRCFHCFQGYTPSSLRTRCNSDTFTGERKQYVEVGNISSDELLLYRMLRRKRLR